MKNLEESPVRTGRERNIFDGSIHPRILCLVCGQAAAEHELGVVGIARLGAGENASIFI
jgi:hypothetical protein